MHIPAIPMSAMAAMLDEMEARFQKALPRTHMVANQKRVAVGRPPLTREQAERVLRVISGGDDVETLTRVEIDADGTVWV